MKMGMRRGGVLAVGALALLAACSGGGDGPPPPPTTGAVTVVNHHCVPIDALYLVPSTSTSWGANQLTASVAPGGSFTIANVPPGQYDVQAIGADGLYWESSGATSIVITAGVAYPWPLYMPEGTGCLQVVNRSSITIASLFASDAYYSCRFWERPEELQGQTIPPDHSFTLSLLTADVSYDLWAENADRSVRWDTCISPPIPVTAGQTATWTLY